MYSPDHWISDSTENLNAAQLLFEQKSPPRLVYLNAFMAVELALKAVAISLGNSDVKKLGHDAIKIWSDGLGGSGHFDETQLSPFGAAWFTALRYPSNRTDNVTSDQAQQALETAKRILNTCRSLISQIKNSLPPIMKWELPSGN